MRMHGLDWNAYGFRDKTANGQCMQAPLVAPHPPLAPLNLQLLEHALQLLLHGLRALLLAVAALPLGLGVVGRTRAPA
jgi:hypothetical protein